MSEILVARLMDALAAIDRRAGSGRLAWELGCSILGAHQPQQDGQRFVCAYHFNTIDGERYDWPCGQVAQLARSLNVSLEPPEVTA